MRAPRKRSETEAVPRKELALLTSKYGLGCRNPVALDEVLASDELALKVRDARKVAVG